jgi:hypothetical protein
MGGMDGALRIDSKDRSKAKSKDGDPGVEKG